MTGMIRPLPNDIQELSQLGWSQIEPHYAQLRETELSPQSVDAWPADSSQLASLLDERYQRLGERTKRAA